MALQSSGSISLSQIGTEFGASAPHSVSTHVGRVGKTAVAGQNVSFSNFYGKFNTVTMSLTIAASTTDYNLKSAATAAGWNGTTPIILTCTINSGVTVYASSTGVYAFQTGTSFPAGSTISIINNGTILGKGGSGGAGGWPTVATGNAGAAGGPAFYAGTACTVTNNGRIAGGGGGGGGGSGG